MTVGERVIPRGRFTTPRPLEVVTGTIVTMRHGGEFVVVRWDDGLVTTSKVAFLAEAPR